jgi:hypothetical protein
VLGPTKFVVETGGTIGFCPLRFLREPRVYFGARGTSGFKTGSYFGPGIILSALSLGN